MILRRPGRSRRRHMLALRRALPRGLGSIGGRHYPAGRSALWLDVGSARGPGRWPSPGSNQAAACDNSLFAPIRCPVRTSPAAAGVERPLSLTAAISSDLRFYHLSPAACAPTVSFAPGAFQPCWPFAAGRAALSFVPRRRSFESVRRTEGQTLCGRGAAWPGMKPGREAAPTRRRASTSLVPRPDLTSWRFVQGLACWRCDNRDAWHDHSCFRLPAEPRSPAHPGRRTGFRVPRKKVPIGVAFGWKKCYGISGAPQPKLTTGSQCLSGTAAHGGGAGQNLLSPVAWWQRR